MKRACFKDTAHDDDFSAATFFIAVALITVLLANATMLTLRHFGAEAFLLDHRAAVWLACLLIGLISMAAIADRAASRH